MSNLTTQQAIAYLRQLADEAETPEDTKCIQAVITHVEYLKQELKEAREK